jgi:hypothetical protein
MNKRKAPVAAGAHIKRLAGKSLLACFPPLINENGTNLLYHRIKKKQAIFRN